MIKRTILGAVLVWLTSCTPAQFAKAADVAKDALEVARVLCLASGQQQTGLSFSDVQKQFCSTRQQLEPWIGIAQDAQRSGAEKTGVKR